MPADHGCLLLTQSGHWADRPLFELSQISQIRIVISLTAWLWDVPSEGGMSEVPLISIVDDDCWPARAYASLWNPWDTKPLLSNRLSISSRLACSRRRHA